MAGKIMCDGCRELFTVAELKAHLGIDSEMEKRGPVERNNRGTRLTTAPFFNPNDPKLTLERCPKRLERVGRAGPMQVDEQAPRSLPIVLPFPMGKAQIEELKDALLDQWSRYQQRKDRQAAMDAVQRTAKNEIAVPGSTALRPREGRNVLIDDSVKQMMERASAAERGRATAPPAVPEAGTSSSRAGGIEPRAASKPVVVPSYMKPLARNASQSNAPASARIGSAAAAAPGRPATRVFVDPQAVGRGSSAGGAGYVRLSSGLVNPIYVKR